MANTCGLDISICDSVPWRPQAVTRVAGHAATRSARFEIYEEIRVPRSGRHKMPAYHCNHIHLIFGTKYRQALIPLNLQGKTWAYMAGIARNYGIHVVAIGGMPDHAHVLVGLPPALSVAKTIQVIKANSSRWLKKQGVHGFCMAGVRLIRRQQIACASGRGVR